MIDFDDEVEEQFGLKGTLLQLLRHLFFLMIGGLLLFLPCYLAFVWAIHSG
jgi:hypothetical protein